ncbi:hypothetical protein QR680_017743 [Steinernema hermaphroditum]|uniref:Phosphoglycerate kinase n=1 Tax=Steinernema hermaphroditum TaxID=289476 RepID=A0AA39LPX6_9BILA|nr:hypothetical protein QR680_017743 [Steinernema hermaphroditum]
MTKLSVDQVPLRGKRVLLRAHLAVHLNADGNVANEHRVLSSISTIEYLLENRARSVVLVSHIDRPHRRRVERLSLKKVHPILERCLGRFHPEEGRKGVNEAQIADFERSLRSHGDIYVNDAFGTSHRDNVSLMGCGMELRCAGLLMKRELEYCAKAVESPERSYVVIAGGAKASEKILHISNVIDCVDDIVIIGGMATIFLKALCDMSIGDSLFDAERAKLVDGLVKKAESKGVRIHLPIDLLIAEEKSAKSAPRVVSLDEAIPDGWMALDIGPKSTEKFAEVIRKAKTIGWNGPAGCFEIDQFDKGTRGIAEAVVEATRNGALSIVGGGDTSTALKKFSLEDGVSHVSTGGGTTLSLLGGYVLPGVEALCSV